MSVYCAGSAELFAFGLSTECGRERSVRLQKRQLMQHDREIAGAGDILLDSVVVSFESVWHSLTADPSLNVVFLEWDKPGQRSAKLGTALRELA